MPATIAYISGNASRRAIPAEFSSERHLRPRNVRVYVSGTCMPRVVDLRASLVHFCPSVCVCVRVCVRVCTHKSRCTHRTTIHRYLAWPPSLGMRRDFTQHMRVMHEYSNVRIAYDASYYRLSSARKHVSSAFMRTGLLAAPMSRGRDRN